MKNQMTRVVGVFGLLLSFFTLIACDGKSPMAPSSESAIASSTSSASGPTANNDPKPPPAGGSAPTNPENPAPPAPPTPPPPPSGPEGPVEQPRVGPCEVLASQWQIVSFVRSPGLRTLVVRNNGSCADYHGGVTFIGTADDLKGQKRHDGKVVLVMPGKTETITYGAPDNGSVCVPVQDDVFRHMSALPEGADYEHFGPGAKYLMDISKFVPSSFIECPKTCPTVGANLTDLLIEEAGEEDVELSVVPNFDKVTLNGNDIYIEVRQQIGDAVAIRKVPVTRNDDGVRVRLGKYKKGADYKLVLHVSDDQVQGCTSPALTFTVPPKNVPTLVCTPQDYSAHPTSVVALSATSGLNSYSWSVPTGQLQSSLGHNASVSFANAGDHTVTVTSGNQSATCRIKVTAAPPPPPPTDVCVGTSGQLIKSPNTSHDGVTFRSSFTAQVTGKDVIATVVGPGFLQSQTVTHGQEVPVTIPQPPRTDGVNVNYPVRMEWKVGGKTCGSTDISFSVQQQPPPPAPLVCTPANQTVNVGQPAAFSSSGPNLPRSWSAPGGSPSSGNDLSFSTVYNTEGDKAVTVTTEGQAPAVCRVTVTAPPPQTCAEKYPSRLDSGTGYAEMQGNKTVVKAQFFAQNVTGRTVAIIWNNTWPKAVVNVEYACAAGQLVPIVFESMEGVHSQASGSTFDLWEVVPGAQPLNSNFTKIGNAPLAVLRWR